MSDRDLKGINPLNENAYRIFFDLEVDPGIHKIPRVVIDQGCVS